MDKLLSGIRALFGQPSRPTGTRVDPISIAKRAPELVQHLLSGKPLGLEGFSNNDIMDAMVDHGELERPDRATVRRRNAVRRADDEFKRLTKNLTPAQRKAVENNIGAFRSYFRKARRARLAATAGRLAGRGSGILTGLGIGAAVQDAVYPRVRGMLPGIDEESEDIQRRLEGEAALLEAAKRFNRNRGRPAPEQQGSYRESAERGLDAMRAVMGSVPQAREEDFRRSVRATQGAIQPVAPSRLQTDTRSLSDAALPGVSGVPDSVAAVDSLRVMDPSISEMRVSNAFDALADADSIRGARRDRRRQEAASQRRTEGIPFMSAASSGPSATQNLIASAIESLDEDVLPLSMRRTGEMGRITLDAIRAAAQERGERPDVSISLRAEAEDPPSLLSPELDMSIDSGLPFGLPDDLSDLVEIIAQEETESPADQLKKIISTLELSGPALRQLSFVPTDTIRVPKITPQRQSSAMRADRAKPRRRLQPTAPGIFGELLDESITDFQGAPMMSEREILRMIRGE